MQVRVASQTAGRLSNQCVHAGYTSIAKPYSSFVCIDAAMKRGHRRDQVPYRQVQGVIDQTRALS